MSTELEFAALHADDLLLDAVGGRREATDTDPVAGLLAAFAADVDTRPIPAERPQPASIPRQGVQDPPPPVPLPLRRRVLAGRVAAIATAGAMVVGIGGVSAAVAGSPGPFGEIGQVVSAVAERVTPERSAADKVTRLLAGARDAIERGDAQTANELLALARTRLTTVEDPSDVRHLQARLRTLQVRLGELTGPATAAVPRGERPDGPADVVDQPGQAPKAAVPNSKAPAATGSTIVDDSSPSQSPEELLPGTGVQDPTERLVPERQPGLGEAKERLKDKADEEIGERVPDEVRDPIGRMRNSTKNEILGPGPLGLLHNAGGDVLAHPEATAVVSDLTDGASGTGSAR